MGIGSGQSAKTQKMGLWEVVGIIFFTVSGGAYGLEALVGTVGAFWTLVLVIVLPILWVIPIALMVAELASAIPEDGGYYIWVSRALGKFWGFQESWWTLGYSIANIAIFPVLFISYLGFFYPQLNQSGWEMFALRALLSVVFIFLSLLLNLRGSKTVGENAAANMLLVSLPFIALSLSGIFAGERSNLVAATTLPDSAWMRPAELAAGLAIVLWNYSGWESIATCASEVEHPQRNFPIALGLSLLIIVPSYVLPLLAGFKVTLNPHDWGDTSGWPSIAEKLGGGWFGWSVGLTALFSTWALYNSQLLCVSYLPRVLARDGWFPKHYSFTSQRTGAPYNSLIAISIVAAAMSILSLKKLIVVDMLFYTLGLALEFIALIVLRKKEPSLHRPFKIKLPTWGLALLSIPPLAIASCVAIFSAMGEEGSLLQLGIVFVGIVAGVAFYVKRKVSGVPAFEPSQWVGGDTLGASTRFIG